MSQRPVFSVLIPVYHPPVESLRETIESVVNQSEASWELILVLDGPHDRDLVSAAESFTDPRIRIVRRDHNGGISAASNSGLEVASGDFVALVDHDDTLAPIALAACREVIERWPDVDVIYSDEDKIDDQGRRNGPFCKPQFSPDWLRCHMYLNHLGVYRRELVDEVGRFRPEFDGAQDHDLALRTTEQARRVVHIPRVLYHWRQSETSTAHDPESKAWAFDAGFRVVADAVKRQGLQARAVRRPGFMGIVDLEPDLTEHPNVSIIVPTAGESRMVVGEQLRLIDRCLASIRDRSTYDHYEVIVVLDRSVTPELEADLRDAGLPRGCVFVRNARSFNFSEACNLGRDHATGDVLVFLNDDTEVLTGDWMERLVMFAVLDGVGAVGARLLYSDGTIQHMGLGSRSGFGHRAVGRPSDYPGPYGCYTVQTNVLSVTGACLAIRADRFDEVGGFSRRFPFAFNDVDLCMKLYRAGYRTVMDPHATLLHHESSSRDPQVAKSEIDLLTQRWQHLVDDDPYDNPHLYSEWSSDVEPEQPPAYIIQLREFAGAERSDPRPWPPDDVFVSRR